MRVQRKKRPESRHKGQEKKKCSPEIRKRFVAQLKELAESMCEAQSIELVHIECQREPRGTIIRLYIDREGGVKLDDCIFISRQFDNLIEVDLMGQNFDNIGPFNLEVSSPGPDRPLGKKVDFERFKGQIVRIKTSQPVDGRKSFKGVLLGMSEDMVKLLINDEKVAIPFEEIISARLINYCGENIAEKTDVNNRHKACHRAG